MDLSRLFSFLADPRNHGEQKPSNLPIPLASRDPYLEKLCASHSSSSKVESPGNPERTSDGHLKRFCKDCKFYVYTPKQDIVFAQQGLFDIKTFHVHSCSEGSYRDLVTGQPKLRDCTIRRNSHASHDECGPAGNKWEPKP